MGLATARQRLAQRDGAIDAFRRSLHLDPTQPAVLAGLAGVLHEAGRLAEAEATYRRALTLAPGDAMLRAGFVHTLRALGQQPEAEAQARLAVRLDPGCGLAQLALGAALLDAGTPGGAEALAAAARLPAEPGEAALAIGMVQLLLGDYAAGWAGYEYRHRGLAPDCPEWDGTTPLAGQRLLVHAEQGLGDTLQFLRFLPALTARGADIRLLVQAPLRRLIAPLGYPLATGPEPADLHAPLLSLPYRLGITAETIPPPIRLTPPANPAWAARIPADGRLRVGLTWSGNPAHAEDHTRSAGLAALAPLLQTPGCRFIMAQTDLRPDDAALLPQLPIDDPRPHLTDLADTASLFQHLDVLVSIDSAPAHLAGCLGLPTHLLLTPLPDWRWNLNSPTTPWYPTHTIHRQPTTGAWTPLVRAVRAALERK